MVHTPLSFYIRGVIPIRNRLPGVFATGELSLPSALITEESFWTPESRFTNFKDHTKIFKGTVILKIDCRLL
jgi:hypothetical protein